MGLLTKLKKELAIAEATGGKICTPGQTRQRKAGSVKVEKRIRIRKKIAHGPDHSYAKDNKEKVTSSDSEVLAAVSAINNDDFKTTAPQDIKIESI